MLCAPTRQAYEIFAVTLALIIDWFLCTIWAEPKTVISSEKTRDVTVFQRILSEILAVAQATVPAGFHERIRSLQPRSCANLSLVLQSETVVSALGRKI